MNTGTLATIVEEGSKLISFIMRNRVVLFSSTQPPLEKKISTIQETTEKSSNVATGCIPCSIGHLGTCSGLLNEAMRFARSDGIQSDEVISRVNMCMDELNALERVDLRPELIHDLSDWERPLADKTLQVSRTLRHDLEQLSSIKGLEGIAAKTQGTRQEIGKAWFKERLLRMSPEQREIVEKRLREKVAQQSKE